MIHLIKKVVFKLLSAIKSRKVTIAGQNVLLHPKARISLIEGASKRNIVISSNASIYCDICACKDGTVFIGEYSKIGYNSSIRCVNKVSIGAYTAIADNVIICDNNNHPINPHDRHIMRQTPSGSFERSWVNSVSKPIVIGNDCWIGQFSRICKGVTIGDGSIVAANSVVTKDVPNNCIVAGNPAKIVKTDIDINEPSIFN